MNKNLDNLIKLYIKNKFIKKMKKYKKNQIIISRLKYKILLVLLRCIK